MFYPNDLGAMLRSTVSAKKGSLEWVVIPTVKGGELGSETVANFVRKRRYGERAVQDPWDEHSEIMASGPEEAAVICETIRDI